MSSVECQVRVVDALVDAVAGKIAACAAVANATPDDVLTLAAAFHKFAEGYAYVAGVAASLEPQGEPNAGG